MADLDLTPGVLHYRIVQGDDFSDTWTIKEDGSAMDLSAYTFAAKVDRPDIAAVAMSFDTSGANVGVLVVSLTDTQTAALAPGRYSWDFQWTDAAGLIRTILAGSFVVLEQVTT